MKNSPNLLHSFFLAISDSGTVSSGFSWKNLQTTLFSLTIIFPDLCILLCQHFNHFQLSQLESTKWMNFSLHWWLPMVISFSFLSPITKLCQECVWVDRLMFLDHEKQVVLIVKFYYVGDSTKLIPQVAPHGGPLYGASILKTHTKIEKVSTLSKGTYFKVTKEWNSIQGVLDSMRGYRFRLRILCLNQEYKVEINQEVQSWDNNKAKDHNKPCRRSTKQLTKTTKEANNKKQRATNHLLE